MREVKENDVAKSLRWLSNMFPFMEHPEDEADRMSNAIHIYSKAGAEKIQELEQELERQKGAAAGNISAATYSL